MPAARWLRSAGRRRSRPGWRTRLQHRRHRSGRRDRPLPEVVAGCSSSASTARCPCGGWRLVTLGGGRAALVWRIHHALADGQTCMRLADEVLWDSPPESRPAARGATTTSAAAPTWPGSCGGSSCRRRPDRPSTARSAPAPGRLRRGAAARAARRGQGAGRRHPERRGAGGRPPARCAAGPRRTTDSSASLRARVPVSLHHQGEDAGNRDSYFCVALPLSEADPVARLRAAHAEAAERKAEHDAEEMDRLLRELAQVSPSLERTVRAHRGGAPAVRAQRVQRPRARPAGQRPGRAGRAPALRGRDRRAPRAARVGQLVRRRAQLRALRGPRDRRRPRRDGRRRRGRGSRR